MVTIRILNRGHSWCIILLNWGVANIAAYPNNQKNCSDGYYWDISAQEHGKPDNGLAHCAKCSELCEFTLNLEILLTNRKCHDVKECRAVLNSTFIDRCQKGFIYDIITELCVDCEYMCTDKFMQHGMEGICRHVCEDQRFENVTLISNCTSEKTKTIANVYGITGFIVGGITIVALSTACYLVCRKRKRKRNSRLSRKFESPISNIYSSDNVHSMHEFGTSCNVGNLGNPKANGVHRSFRLNDSENYEIGKMKSNIKLKSECSIKKEDNDDGKNTEMITTTPRPCSIGESKSATWLSNDSMTEQQSLIKKASTDIHENVSIPNGNVIHNTYQKIPTYADANELSYTNTDNRTTTYVSETPELIDIFSEEKPIKDPADGVIMLSYTSELPTDKLMSTSDRNVSTYSSDITSTECTTRTHKSMTGMSLYSYDQQDSLVSYQQNTNDRSPSETTHSSVYSFKQTVFTEDDLKIQCDQNDKNAPHIKGAEEHGNLTADEIEQLPKDMSDIPDIQNKLQYLAQKQYVKRIISNGRYIKVWYDALDQANAERFIGQILGASKGHYCCEYVYNH